MIENEGGIGMMYLTTLFILVKEELKWRLQLRK